MSICIAYKDTENDRIICACDKLVMVGNNIHTDFINKMFKKNGLIYLLAGEANLGQLLQYEFNYHLPYDINTDDAMCSHFKNAFKKFASEHTEILDENGDLKNDSIIVANNQIYFVNSDLTITKSYHNYACIGSGKNIAYGALYALQNIENYSIKDKLIIAVNACNEFLTTCDNNIQIIQSDD